MNATIQPDPGIDLLSAGAAKGLVTQLQGRFLSEQGYDIRAQFGAVGLMRDRLLDGAACDLVILSQGVIEKLIAGGHVVGASVRPIGLVQTGVAYRNGDPAPRVENAHTFKESLLAASAIYFPDPEKATAGIHFAKILKSMGLEDRVAQRLRPYPNGATAMHELSIATEVGGIGCTQVTEILYTPGVTLAATLPEEFELTTLYVAAITTGAIQPDAARDLIELLTSPDAAALRRLGGFEPIA